MGALLHHNGGTRRGGGGSSGCCWRGRHSSYGLVLGLGLWQGGHSLGEHAPTPTGTPTPTGSRGRGRGASTSSSGTSSSSGSVGGGGGGRGCTPWWGCPTRGASPTGPTSHQGNQGGLQPKHEVLRGVIVLQQLLHAALHLLQGALVTQEEEKVGRQGPITCGLPGEMGVV